MSIDLDKYVYETKIGGGRFHITQENLNHLLQIVKDDELSLYVIMQLVNDIKRLSSELEYFSVKTLGEDEVDITVKVLLDIVKDYSESLESFKSDLTKEMEKHFSEHDV